MASNKSRRRRKKSGSRRRGGALTTVAKGLELEDLIARIAGENGWRVEKRRRFDDRVLDLVIEKGGVVFIIQCKNTSRALPSDVTQTRRDFDAYVNWLLGEKLKIQVASILVSNSFSKGARGRARSYGVMLYTIDELKRLLTAGKKSS